MAKILVNNKTITFILSIITTLFFCTTLHVSYAWSGLPIIQGRSNNKNNNKVANTVSSSSAADDQEVNVIVDNDNNENNNNNRRLLFQTTSAIATASIIGSVTTSYPTVATAAGATAIDSTSSKSNNKIYIPQPNSMNGKVVLITGGNTGLGLESGKRLAAAGAEVIITSRTTTKGTKAVEDIQQYLSKRGITNDKVYALPLDLCDMDSIKLFPKLLEDKLKSKKSIDVLMNNAGVMAIQSREVTKDGFERTFQTNHLGHFVLTSKLVPLLSNDARIINVSSDAYQIAGNKGLDFDNLNSEKEYGPWTSYGASKLENIYFTKELQQRANAAGKSWVVSSLHPGMVATDLGRYFVGEDKWNTMKENGMSLKDKLLFVPLSKITKTVEDGASTQIFLAADDNVSSVANGQYFVDCKVQNLKGPPTDVEQSKKLWEVSEQLSGVKFNL